VSTGKLRVSVVGVYLVGKSDRLPTREVAGSPGLILGLFYTAEFTCLDFLATARGCRTDENKTIGHSSQARFTQRFLRHMAMELYGISHKSGWGVSFLTRAQFHAGSSQNTSAPSAVPKVVASPLSIDRTLPYKDSPTE
jgi:hypothetical protein